MCQVEKYKEHRGWERERPKGDVIGKEGRKNSLGRLGHNFKVVMSMNTISRYIQ